MTRPLAAHYLETPVERLERHLASIRDLAELDTFAAGLKGRDDISTADRQRLTTLIAERQVAGMKAVRRG